MNQTGVHIDAILCFSPMHPPSHLRTNQDGHGGEGGGQISGTLKAQVRQIGAGTIGEHQV